MSLALGDAELELDELVLEDELEISLGIDDGPEAMSF